MLDLRPPLDACFFPFSVPVSVTPVGGPTIETEGVWFAAPYARLRAFRPGLDQEVSDLRPRLKLRRSAVPDLPADSLIVAPDLLGGAPRQWRVARVENPDDQEVLEVQVLEVV